MATDTPKGTHLPTPLPKGAPEAWAGEGLAAWDVTQGHQQQGRGCPCSLSPNVLGLDEVFPSIPVLEQQNSRAVKASIPSENKKTEPAEPGETSGRLREGRGHDRSELGKASGHSPLPYEKIMSCFCSLLQRN